jgi:ferredoxin-NADP reductase
VAVVLIAAGTGIVPFRVILEWLRWLSWLAVQTFASHSTG